MIKLDAPFQTVASSTFSGHTATQTTDVPLFIHIMDNGDVWESSDISFTPSGSVAATYKFSSLTHNDGGN